MSRDPPRTRCRKRNRQVEFDLNRSSPHIQKKIQKPNTPSINKESSNNRKMTEEKGNANPIRDLSHTIISGTSQTSRGNNIVHTDVVAQGTSKQTNKANGPEAMQENIRRQIEQGVNSQVADIKKTMADLAATVSRLSVVVQQTQLENRRLLESQFQNVPQTADGAQQAMDISGVQANSAQTSRDSSICSEESRQYNRPRIDKWGLEFDGNSSKLAVEDFVFRLERLQRQYGVSWKEVLDNFHLLVKGAAERWYWLFIQTNYVSEWSTLKSAMLKQFQAARSSFELMRDMVERKQMPGESIDEFFFAMTQFRSRLEISMPEAEMIKMIKKNLKDSIGRIVYPMSVSSVEELRITCLDAEKTFLKKDNRQQPTMNHRYPRHVNEIAEDKIECQPTVEDNSEEVAAVSFNNNNKNKTIAKMPLNCWNCHQNGHAFMDCPAEQRTIFCFRCGKPDVIAPNCEACRKRNFPRSEGRAGDLRVSMNPLNNKPE